MGIKAPRAALCSMLAAAAVGLTMVGGPAAAAGAATTVAGQHSARTSHHHRHGTSTTPAPKPTAASAGSAATAGSAGLSAVFGPQFSSRTFCGFSHQNVTAHPGFVTVSYPAGSSAPSAGAPYGGAQLCAPFASGPKTDVTLTYQLRMPVGFQFVQGGKLPGVYGGVEPFSGGSHNAYGWSMRLMWRTAGAGEVYGYISTTSGYGDSWGRGNFRWKADGRWHTVTEHVHLNSPGKSDGWVTLAYDGVRAIDQTGLAVTTTGTPANGLFFSTFYGGHDSTWAPTADEHIDFANFRVS